MSTSSTSHRSRLLLVGAIAAAGALTLAGCGSSSGKSSSGTSPSVPASSAAAGSSAPATSGGSGADQAAVAKLPAALKSKGTLTVAMDPSYAPNEFYGKDNKTIVGMDVDLANALAAKLGLKAQPTAAKFDSIIPGLKSGKYDLGMSSFTDTLARQKTVDFVTYYSAGTSLMVPKGNPKHLKPGDLSLCGTKVAVEKGTVQQTPDIPNRTKKCKAAGKSAVTALPFDDEGGANLALSSGRADAVLADSPVAAYAAKQSNGRFEISGASYGNAPYGIAIPKNEGTMKQAVQIALKSLIADGTYKKIMDKWGIDSGAITAPQINAATS